MGLMTMQMSGSGLWSVPSEHLPGLVVLVVIGPAVWIALSGCRALAAGGGSRAGGLDQAFRRSVLHGQGGAFRYPGEALVRAAIIPTR